MTRIQDIEYMYS